MFLSFLYSLFSRLYPLVPPGLIFFAAPALLEGSNLSVFKSELFGTILMIGLTFSPGKWIVENQSPFIVWLVHAFMVITADYVGGGQHVNPSMSIAMVSMNKCGVSQAYTRISGQMVGGLLAFPLFHWFSSSFHFNALGGPDFGRVQEDNLGAVTTLALSEFMATFWLCLAVCVLNFHFHFGRYHYWIKQSMTAIAIRILIQLFPTTGPAMNPMLATAWAVFAYGTYPQAKSHYFIYWVSSILGALFGALLYTLWAGGVFLGWKVHGISGKQVSKIASSTTKKKKT